MKIEKNKIKGFYIPLLILVLFSLLFIYFVHVFSEKVVNINYGDIFSEGFITLFTLFWVGIIAKIYKEKKLFIPLFVGFSLFFLGSLADFLDEFFILSIGFVEYIIPVGLAIVSYGIIKWMHALIRKTTELEIKNKKLEQLTKKYKVKSKKFIKAKKEVKIKNKKLEEALEGFYELRVSVEKDKKKAKEENKKIRKRIDKLKK